MYKGRGFYTDVFVKLGKELERFGHTSRSCSVIEEAVVENPWFTRSDIIFAVAAVRSHMLAESVLERWQANYETSVNPGRRVAVIMAGNIPLVGFSDLMCVLAAGDIPCVKTSSKDRALMEYIIRLLKSLAPDMRIEEYIPGERYEAVIATGSDNTGRYFQSQFAGIPSIIRGSRSSAAVIRGDETPEQLRMLSRDIFLYSGLGCRNVSMVLTPHNYDLEGFAMMSAPVRNEINIKYYNNYRTTRARLVVEGTHFIDGGAFVITLGNTFPVDLSNIVALRYDEISEVYKWLCQHDSKLQCVVGSSIEHPRSVDFGQSQLPAPWDYPDGVDVREFLAAL